MYNLYTPLRRLTLLLLLAMLGFSNQAMATHATGADLQYVWLGGNTYRIVLNFYRDCAGIAAPTAPIITIKGCSAAQNTTLTLSQLGPPTPVLPTCPAAGPSTCAGGTNPGIERYTYTGTVTLNATPCANWIFSWQHSARNNAITDIANPGGQDLYVQAILNNAAFPNNNSSDFSTEPVPYICSGFPFTFNHGAFDADGDSLVYSMVTPMNGPNSTVAYLPGFSAANPITTTPANNTVFNAQNGQLTFTPNGTQQGIVAILVKEYRNGVFIGSTMRDMQVLVAAGGCNNSSPSFATPTAVSGGSFNATAQTFRVCPGGTLNFTTVVSDPNPTNILTVTSGGNLTGATVNISGTPSTTGPRTVTVSWTPTAADVGNHTITFGVRDNSCPTNGSGSQAFTVVVPGVEAATNRNDICLGTPRTFNLTTTAYGGTTGQYLWTAVPAATFTPSATSASVSATITQPTVFTVRYTIGSCIVQDTIQVRAYSNLLLTPNNFTYCAGGTPAQLDANYINNYVPPVTHVCGIYSGAACTGAANTPVVGTGTATTGTGNAFGAGSPYQGNQNGRIQYIYTKAELNTAGIQAGILRKMAFFVSNKNSNFTYNGFTIKIKCIPTATTAFGPADDFGTLNSPAPWVTVYVGSPSTALGWNEYNFQNAYDWDGNQNLAVEICYNRGQSAAVGTNYDHVQYSNAPNRVLYSYGAYRVLNPGSSNRCGDNRIQDGGIFANWLVDGGGRSSNRPNTRFDYCNNTTPNITFTWSPPAGLSATNIKNPTANPAAPTTYTVTATDGVCAQTATVVVTPIPCTTCTATASIVPLPTELTCSNTSLQLNASVSSPIIIGGANPTTWAWSGPSGPIPATQPVGVVGPYGGNTPRPTIVAGGTYTVTMTNVINGVTCSSTASIVVTANNLSPAITIPTAIIYPCISPTTTISATVLPAGNYTYQWVRPGGGQAGILSGATTPNALVNQLGSYIIVVTNTTNGCIATETTTVNPDPASAAVIAIAAPPLLTCAATSVIINASGSANAQEFSWVGPSGTSILSGALSATPTVGQVGTYSVTVTGNNGCTATSTVLVGQNITPPIAIAGPDGTIRCNLPTVDIGGISPSSPVLYDWSSGPTPNAPFQTIDVTGIGTYTVTVTSDVALGGNGCTASDVVVVFADTLRPAISLGTTATLTCSVTSVTLGGAPTSGVAGAQFQWTTLGGTFTSAPTVANPTASAPGTYTVEVVNAANGCTNVASQVVIQDLSTPTANAGTDAVLTCTTPCVTIGTPAITGNTYDWGGGITTPTRNNICGVGTYTVTVTKTATGCTATSSITLTENKVAPTADAGTGGIFTCSNTNITLGGNPTTTTPGATCNWGTGIGTSCNPIVMAPAASYTVTVTDPSNGCTATSAVQTTSNFATPSANAGVTKRLTCTITDVMIGTPTVLGVTYAWNGPSFLNGIANIAQPSATAAGVYTVVVTDDVTGCTSGSTVTVTQDIAQPNANAGTNQTITCLNQLVGVTIGGNPTSNTPGASYQWTAPLGNVSNPSGIITPGTYTVTVTNPTNGCINISSVEVLINTTAPDASAGADKVLTCATQSVVIGGNPTSSIANATYAWTGGGTGPTKTVSTPGIYIVTVSNPANGCSANSSVTVTQDIAAPDAIAGPDMVRTCTSPTVMINVTSTAPSVTYNWSVPGVLPTVTVGANGIYTVTVTSGVNGCTAFTSVLVTQDIAPPGAAAGADQVLTCANTCRNIGQLSTTIDPVTYLWSTGATTAIINVCATGNYTVTVTRLRNGCTASDMVSVTQDTVKPNANAGINKSITCNATSALIGVASSTTSGVSYQWDNGPTPTAATQLVTAAGNYCVTVTSILNGCTKDDCVTVSINTAAPAADAGLTKVLTCATPDVQIGTPAIAGNTYTWTSTNSGTVGFVTSANIATPRVNRAGTYTVIVTNTVNGCFATATVIVTEDKVSPIAVAGAPQTIICTTPLAGVTIGGISPTVGVTYKWSLDLPPLLPRTTPTIDVNAIGTYTVTVTRTSNGCTASATTTVSQNKIIPNANAGPDRIQTCTNNGSVVLNGSSSTPGVTYAWSNIVATLTQTVTTAGTYTLIVTNPLNGCAASDVAIVTDNRIAPNVNAGVDKVLTCAVLTTSIGGNPTSTTPNVTYAWSNGAGASALPTVNSPNTYIVTVTNTQNGCIAKDTVIVTANKVKPIAVAGPPQSLNCNTATSGGVSIGAVSPTASPTVAVSYLWNNLNPNPTQTVNLQGVYTVTVTNLVNGCKQTSNVAVTGNFSPPPVTIAPAPILTCYTTTGVTLNVVPSSIPTINYAWPNGITGPTSGIITSPGSYCVTATNSATGCTASSCASVINNLGGVQAIIRPAADLTCLVSGVNLDACGSIPLGFPEFKWSPNAGSSNTCAVSVSAAGVYTVTVTNLNNGCTASATVDVRENRFLPNANAGTPQTLTCTRTTVQVGVASTTAPPIRYQWSNGGGLNPSATFGATGTYTVTVTNVLTGCFNTSEVVVDIDTIRPNANAGLSQILNCAVNSVTLTASSATPNVGYTWGSSAGVINTAPTIAVTTVGTYTVTVTSNINGCTSKAQTSVTRDATKPDANAGTSRSLSCAVTDVTIGGLLSSATPTSTTVGATFAWGGTSLIFGASNGITALVRSAGIYTVTVTHPVSFCTKTSSVIVTRDGIGPNINAGVDKTVTCFQTNAQIGGTSTTNGAQYQWNVLDPVSGVPYTTPFIIVSPSVTTTYTMVVTNPSNGCTASQEVTVVADNAPPTILIPDPGTITCQNNTVTLSAANSSPSPLAFQWSTGAFTPQITVGSPGTYTVTVTNSNTGCTASGSRIVTPLGAIPQMTTTVTNLTCNGYRNGAISLAVLPVASYNYAWSGSGTQQNQANQTGLAAGTYSVVVTDANACSIARTFVIAEPQRLNTTVITTPSQCSNDGAVATATTGGTLPYTFVWSANVPASVTTPTANNLSAGDYFVTVTDANTCSTTAKATVIGLTTITPDAQITKVTCNGGRDGKIQLVINGDNPPFSVSWAPTGTNVNPLTNLFAGNYIVTITDAIGCKFTTNYPMLQPEPLVVTPRIKNPSCNGAEDGEIYLETSGGNGGNIFNWSRANEYSAYLYAVAAGNYSVTVTDVLGCTYRPSAYIVEEPTPVVITTVAIQPPSCYGKSDAVLTPSASGGTPDYQFDWGSDIGLGVARDLPTGIYTVTVSDSHGCSKESSVTVVQPPIMEATLSQMTQDCSSDDKGSITVDNVIGGNGGPYTYALNNAAEQNTTLFSELEPGIYNIHIFDVNKCELIEQRIVRAPSPLLLDAGGPFTIQMGDSIELTPRISGAFNPSYQYSWTPANTVTFPNQLQTYVHPIKTTNYVLTVLDISRGCSVKDNVLVEVINPINIYVPNVFTPDGNGRNDMFIPLTGLGIEKIAVFRIYDRWGELVFENNNFLPNDESQGWNGMLKGVKMNPANYIYYLEFELTNGKKEVLSGDVTLMR
jgi:gliding motility-associated-like protein